MKVIYFRYESHIHPFILLLFWETRKINLYVVRKSSKKNKKNKKKQSAEYSSTCMKLNEWLWQGTAQNDPKWLSHF